MDLLTFDPILKTTRWGGRRLGSLLNKPIGTGNRYAESWELADLTTDQSQVNHGDLKSLSIHQLINEHKNDILGKHSSFNHFPILVKFLDVSDRLSLQVHPDDVYSQENQFETSGKTESWIILKSSPESKIFAGLKKTMTPENLSDALKSGEIDSCIHSFHVKPGDAILVPAGTVHALGEGILLAEYQQMSQLTFRLHDWGRFDLNGQPRELHWEHALECINYQQLAISPETPVTLDEETGLQELIRCKHFVIRKYQTSRQLDFSGTDNFFRIFTMISGSAEVIQNNQSTIYQTGQTILAPAQTSGFSIIPKGEFQLLESFLP